MAGLVASGCVALWVSRPHTPCLPEALQLTKSVVPAGGATELSSPPSKCKLKGIARASYSVTLETIGRQSPLVVATARPLPDGSFRLTIHLPEGTSPGEAVLDVGGSAYDAACRDTSDKCASYGVGLTVIPSAASK